MNLLEIKHKRLSEAERVLHDIFDGLVEYKNVDYPDRVSYVKSYNVIFEYHTIKQTLWYSYVHIRLVFHEFEFTIEETNKMLKTMVEIYLKLNVKKIWY